VRGPAQLWKKKEKKPEPAAQEANPATASVTLFAISTELTAVNEDDVSGKLFEVPAGWEKVANPTWQEQEKGAGST